VKTRLGIDQFDVTNDVILTNAIKAVTARFDKICNRALARTVNATQEFDAADVEILPSCYPIEAVNKFEVKENETDGWIEQTAVKYLLREGCVISLETRLGFCGRARVTYTGGYVLPGATVGAGQTALPDDLEQAAVEQVASWFYHRDKLGLVRNWPKGGVYEEFLQAELLIGVREVLRGYERMRV
jgi:hypothetical protein